MLEIATRLVWDLWSAAASKPITDNFLMLL